MIWNEINQTWMPDEQRVFGKRRVFLGQLGKALVTAQTKRNKSLPHTAAPAALVRSLEG